MVAQPGTYFYHGHFGSQRAAGFYGALIVDLPAGKHEPYHYDGEHMIIVNDWWHRPIVTQEQGLEAIPFKFVGDPQVRPVIAHTHQLSPRPLAVSLLGMRSAS